MVSILEVSVISGMLDFRIDADSAAGILTLTFSQHNHFVQGRYLIQTVVLLITVGASLNGVQSFDFLEGKIAGEPIVVYNTINHALGLAAGKFRMARDVGRGTYHRFMTGDHVAVLGQHKVRLDKIGTHFDSQGIAFQCVFGAITGSTAVTDNDRAVTHKIAKLHNLPPGDIRTSVGQCAVVCEGEGL